ncbi:MAG: bifunctional transaldolase/phosoglucose isomerase [Blastocatellia bacterium]
MNPLVELQKLGQSIWYDNIRRALIDNGDIAGRIAEDDLRGITSNPTIFEKAIAGSEDYNEAMRKLIAAGATVNEIYEALAIEDIQRASDLFKPVYERTKKLDGYVSLEVSPLLAHDTERTIAEAKRLWGALNRPNVMIKIPATPAGLPAITEVIASGINVNVTMIFSMDNYAEVAEAYIAGLEKRAAAGKPIDHVASVASVFVSRIDSAVDSRLEAMIAGAGDEAAKARLSSLLGKVAIANTKMQYQKFREIFATGRFAKLAAKGGRPQRPLWASTGTKNPNYRDVLYIEELIAADTVNTVPPATYAAFLDHGKVRLGIEEDLDGAIATMARLAEAGIDIDQVCRKLQDDGVKSFADSFESLMQSITSKQATLTSGLLDRMEASLGAAEAGVDEAIRRAESEQWTSRIHRRDASLWKSEEEHQKIIRNSLGWVTVPEHLAAQTEDLAAFSAGIRNDSETGGFKHVMLLGMGGSSLCPEVFRRAFGKQPGFPEIHVLDSTDPMTVAAFESRVDLAKTLFVVASKSGTTTEPLMFYKYFFNRMREIRGDRAGESFVAITDPGPLMEQAAKEDKFRRIFLNPADIGGRYSALSFFGIVPAALQGIDFKTLLARAVRAMHACAPPVPAADNPAVRLGAILGALAGAGRNKMTLTTDPRVASVGLWIEQLVAESTGKEGRGIVPVAGEPLGAPGVYGADRLFVHIAVGMIEPDVENRLRELEAAGHPVVRRVMTDLLDLGEEFYLWEMATAIAGKIMGINPFDQPNVQESKDNTRRLLDEFKAKGRLTPQSLAAEGEGLKVLCTNETIGQLGKGLSSEAFIVAHLKRAAAGDYIALLDYIQETDAHESLIQAIRMHLRDALHVATTTGYGPRFLHSTGQLHKGGDDSGVFVQITADPAEDLALPGEPFGFGVLIKAQSLGDFESLASRHRRAIRVHLGQEIEAGLMTLLRIVQAAFPLSQKQAQ